MKMMKILLSALDRGLRDELSQMDGYANAYATMNILAMYHLVEQLCEGRGAISIFQLVAKILKMKQGDKYTTYAKDFKDT